MSVRNRFACAPASCAAAGRSDSGGTISGSSAAPFDVGPDSVLVAYAAAAELSCFLELGWPLPVNVIDLFAEHRVATNGIPLPCGNGLLGALAIRGLAHIDAGEKEEMRRLILSQTDYSDVERTAILAYCMSE